MALNLNLQGFVDSMVNDMLKSDSERHAEKVITSKFDTIIMGQIKVHTEAIKELKAESDGSNINASAIAYHERRLAYYQA